MDKVLGYLGLARRARKLIFGEEIFDSFASGKIKILFLANDMSESSFERYNKTCTYYHIPIIRDYDTLTLNATLGKANIKACALTDHGFAEAIKKERRCADGENNQKE